LLAGRNNSGKTSVAELLHRVLEFPAPKFAQALKSILKCGCRVLV
jgi:hypothetical protein